MSNSIITAIIVILGITAVSTGAHADEYAKSRELIKELRKLEPRFEEVYRLWKRDGSGETWEYPRKYSEKYDDIGFIPYNRSYILYTYDRSIPQDKEINKKFSLEMAKGELEPLSISLFTLSRIMKLTVKIEEFIDGDGNVFDSSHIRAYHVLSLPMAYSRKYLNRETEAMKKHIYEIQPTFLVTLPHYSAEKNKSLQIILDFKSTEKTKPGTYIGSLLLKADDKKEYRIPITLKVNDIVLDDASHWQRGLFQSGTPSVEVLKLQKEWGFNSIAFWWWKGGHFYFGNARDGEIQFKSNAGGIGYHLENMKEAGFGTSWVYFLMEKGFSEAVGNWTHSRYPSEKYRLQYINALGELFKYCEKNHYPLPVLVPMDEPSGHNLDRFLQESLWISEAFDFAKIYTVLFRKNDHNSYKEKGYLNLWVSNNPSPVMKKAAEENGSQFGIYRGVHIKRPISDTRFHYGYKSLWFDADYTFGWANNFIKKHDPFFDFRGKEGFGHSVIYEMPSGPVPTLSLLALREAIDDRRYAETLMKKKPGSAAPFMKNLKKKIFSRIVPEGPHVPQDLPEWTDPWTYGQIIQTQDPVFLNDWRKEVTKKILEN